MSTEELTQKEANEVTAVASKTGKGWIVATVVACLLTVVAWLSMMASPDVSLWCSIAGLVISFVSAIKSASGMWRDLSITCIIACAVLLLVYGIFYFGLAYVVKSLG